VGSSIPAILDVIVGGTCVPYVLHVDVPACDDLCM
jgi:hypothetical protein